jgi:hypothetical protein
VVVPPDLLWYVVDQDQVDRDWGEEQVPRRRTWEPPFNPQRQLMLQAHRWVSWVRLPEWLPSREFKFGPFLGMTGLPVQVHPTFLVGDWVVAERVRVARGEYIDRPLRVDVPVRRATHDRFELAEEPDAPRHTRGVKIDFGVPAEGKQPGTVLVDFSGGKVTHERHRAGMKPVWITDSVQMEALFLSPDGCLVARSGADDVNDDTRSSRVTDYRARIEQLRKANAKGNRR